MVGWLVEIAMAGMNLFMLLWGVRLVHTTWFQAISDFPLISVGISYLPVPIGGAITLCSSSSGCGPAGCSRSRPPTVSWLRAPIRALGPSHGRAHPRRRLRGLCALGMPVAYALGLAAVLAALWIDIPLEAVMLKVSDGTDDFALLAIPFFILAGGIMAEGGLAERLVNLAKVFVGFIRGGLALVNILASAFFGCISGSSVADTASIGTVMVPQMEKNGYPRLFATSVTCAGCCSRS